MTKKPWSSRKGINHFRFESTLTPDAAMERLHDLSPVELTTVDHSYRQIFQVKSQKLDDTIYFEIKIMGNADYMPAMLGQIIRGQIRAIDSNRTLVEGDLKYSPQVKFFGLVIATLLGGGSIWAFLTGSMPAEDLLSLVGITVVSIIFFRLFATGKGGRNLTIDRIEQQVWPLWKKPDSASGREGIRLSNGSERLGDEKAAEKCELFQKPQDDG